MKKQETSKILNNKKLQNDYYQADLEAPSIAPLVVPGQFIHIRFPALQHKVLRRPFSVFDINKNIISIVYKIVGEGTQHFATLQPGEELDLLGPLGNGYTIPVPDSLPVIVAGGYGAAATYLIARTSPVPCLCLIGGRSQKDVLLVDNFKAAGATVKVATDDGSQGHKGMVTDLLQEVFEEYSSKSLAVYACGPNAMLKRVSEIVYNKGLDAEVSLDHAMCCGVGACYACVVKMKADNEEGWQYVRTCRDGPVFNASKIYWD